MDNSNGAPVRESLQWMA